MRALIVFGALLLIVPLVGVGTADARDLDGGICDDPDSSYPDVASEDTDQAAGCLADYGIAQGYTDGNFRPGEYITREQMASFIARKLEAADQYSTPEVVPPHAYTDRSQIADVHVANVDLVTFVGIAEGKDDGSFDPGGNVTRAQMAALIVRQIEEMTGQPMPRPATNQFNDSGDSWAEDYIEKLGAAGISQGDGQGNFMPNSFVTRGQMALFVARDIDYLVEVHGFTFTPVDAPPETDDVDSLSLAPASSTNNTGTSHTVTATATADGNPSEGAQLRFEVVRGGSVVHTGQGTTNADGQTTFSYTGPASPTTDTIRACVNENGTRPTACDPNNDNQVNATATKNWIAPAPPPYPPAGQSGDVVATGDAGDTAALSATETAWYRTNGALTGASLLALMMLFGGVAIRRRSTS